MKRFEQQQIVSLTPWQLRFRRLIGIVSGTQYNEMAGAPHVDDMVTVRVMRRDGLGKEKLQVPLNK